MGVYRTNQTQHAYELHKEHSPVDKICALCHEIPLENFEHWKLMVNKFPYDKISSTHHLIVPKRHVVESELTSQERDELMELKNTVLDERYTIIIEPLPRHKSIPAHFHLHLIIPKEII